MTEHRNSGPKRVVRDAKQRQHAREGILLGECWIKEAFYKDYFPLPLRFLPIVIAGSVIALTSCGTQKNVVYRDFPRSFPDGKVEFSSAHNGPLPDDIDCSQDIVILSDDYSQAILGPDRKKRLDALRCHIATYKFPSAEDDKNGMWQKLASDRGRVITNPDSYTLSFIEMPEIGSKLLKPQQLDDLTDHLGKSDQDVVFVYVHGWRHDADIGNRDVRKFRTMLNYTRSALNSRCIDAGEYCKSQLTGVYVAWRGRSFPEPTSGKLKWLTSPFAFATAWDRKRQSEKLAGGYSPAVGANKQEIKRRARIAEASVIGQVLRKINDKVDTRQGDRKADKLMILGHSYGANMLATYMQNKTLNAISEHKNGAYLQPIIGDLVVLLNPAAEAEKWTSLQRAIRYKVEGMHKGLVRVSSLKYNEELMETCKDSQKIINDADLVAMCKDPQEAFNGADLAIVGKWKSMFPRSQRPTYISLTATGDWVLERKAKSDIATRYMFPISRLLAGKTEREDIVAIGHLRPKFKKTETKEKEFFNLIDSEPVGATHEMAALEGRGKTTNIASSIDPLTAWCGPHNGWLSEAQARTGNTNHENWDSGIKDDALLRNMASPTQKPDDPNAKNPYIQIRNALYFKEGVRSESAAQGYAPFWNIRALDTTIVKHSGFMNFPTLCGLHLLWLDDPIDLTNTNLH